MLLLRSPARIASRLTRYTWGLPAVWRPTRIRLAAPSSVGPATRPIASDTRVSRWSGKVAGRWTWPRMVIAMLFEATRETVTWGLDDHLADDRRLGADRDQEVVRRPHQIGPVGSAGRRRRRRGGGAAREG